MRAPQQTLKRFGRWLGLAILATGVVGGGIVVLRGREAPVQAEQTTGPKPAAVVTVHVISPTPIPEFSEAVGTIRSRTTTVLSSKVMGYVRGVLAREGDGVKAGQPLILLDDRDLAAQVRRAEAALDEAHHARDEAEKGIAAAEASKAAAEANGQFAEATWRRYQLMLEQQAVSHQEYDAVLAKQKTARAELVRAEATIQSLQAKQRQVLARIAQAKAEVANAQVSLGYATLRAPLDGVVLEKRVEVGALAAPGVLLLTLEDPRGYRLEAHVPESRVGGMALGMQVAVTVEALGRQEQAGTIGEMVPTADPASRTFVVKIDLPQVAGLRSGMYGKARFPTRRSTGRSITGRSGWPGRSGNCLNAPRGSSIGWRPSQRPRP